MVLRGMMREGGKKRARAEGTTLEKKKKEKFFNQTPAFHSDILICSSSHGFVMLEFDMNKDGQDASAPSHCTNILHTAAAILGRCLYAYGGRASDGVNEPDQDTNVCSLSGVKYPARGHKKASPLQELRGMTKTSSVKI